ncbi:LuxR C-terminal-related transcriptional regulator [Streptomyces sp. NPDC092369]|uniref:helix-turn-helix transcriptional regulator n=1 Tax=Streptomyces sp. NPDC092369 TaxID=3366015 RepID=UPI0038237FEB
MLRASDAILEHAATAYLQSCSRIDVASPEGPPAADVSVLLLNTLDDEWMRVLRQDAARAPGPPVPVVVMADRITERQLALAIEYGLTSFLYRGHSNLDQLVDAIVKASAGRSHMPDDLLGHLIAELGYRQRQQTLTDLAKKGGLLMREIEVLRMLSEGLNTVEIADRMSYSERTIKGIIHDAVKRLKVKNRTQAVAYAIRVGIF